MRRLLEQGAQRVVKADNKNVARPLTDTRHGASKFFASANDKDCDEQDDWVRLSRKLASLRGQQLRLTRRLHSA
jgi:hypothetical protein